MVSGVGSVGGNHPTASTRRSRSLVDSATHLISPGVGSHGSLLCSLASIGGMSHGSSLLNGGHRNLRIGKIRRGSV
jgi:hypothetical protein